MAPISAIEQRILSAQSDGRLSLCDQCLTAVPESAWTLSSSKTELGWWQKSPLISIDLSQNELDHIDVPALEELHHVNLSINRLQSITVRAPALLSLNISNNRLKSLPDLPSSLASLSVMNNELEIIDALPCNLKVLHAAHNRLGTAPSLPALLEVLDLSDNRLDSVSVDHLSHLKQANELSTCPVIECVRFPICLQPSST